jgi:hypothetical protein
MTARCKNALPGIRNIRPAKCLLSGADVDRSEICNYGRYHSEAVICIFNPNGFSGARKSCKSWASPKRRSTTWSGRESFLLTSTSPHAAPYGTKPKWTSGWTGVQVHLLRTRCHEPVHEICQVGAGAPQGEAEHCAGRRYARSLHTWEKWLSPSCQAFRCQLAYGAQHL